MRNIESPGTTKVILQADPERPVVRLLKNALRALRVDGLDQASEKHPPRYDPQASGAMENVVGNGNGRLRTCILRLEERVRHRVPPDNPIVAWLVEYVAFLMRVQI